MFNNQKYLDFMSFLLVAGLGGVVRTLVVNDRVFLITFVKHVVISAFAGAMVYFVLDDLTAFDNLMGIKGMLVGMAGYSGAQTLECLNHYTQKKLKSLRKDL